MRSRYVEEQHTVVKSSASPNWMQLDRAPEEPSSACSNRMHEVDLCACVAVLGYAVTCKFPGGPALTQWWKPDPNPKLGATAGVMTVYFTMRFDVVKARLHSCASNLVKQEGVKAVWKASTPRLTRLIFSGGIAFTKYKA